MDVLDRAEKHLQLHGRLIDRLRFEALFRGGSRERVLDVLRCYQNPDGGFGHALEPDLRGAGSQPEPVEVAFWILDELDAFDSPMVPAACDYLASITAADGGVPFVLPSVRDDPRGPWWQTDDDPPGNLIPTASLAGLLHKHAISHPWLATATDFCWSRIGAVQETSPYEARAIVTFLDLVPDRERAEAEFARLRQAILATVALDPDEKGEAHFPLDFAAEPLRLPLFTQEVLETHLDALLAAQSDDGGWNGNWPMWTPLVEHEWGGYITVGKLKTLRAYGRLPTA
ncbi:prenyltransferase/squalene oxidase-like repeat protein [Nonomuraea polychroma]|uniref:Prenyltransferase/squalene oxidase-like repeat protein n=1 Tax=Nonomuraea polychroma TaxID=46176 RepID=A0A438LWG6_9ACTN|nr:prenyltransferase/squalene oxidase repeat-containing protein [Nonomuraea polychroma]RVX37811.1 prenyltransferase/squalene oxidase-like repeat protein [Nonomuraea polychroma]